MKLLIEGRTLSDAIKAYTAKGGQMESVYPTKPEDYDILKNAIKNSVITLDKDIYRGVYFKSKDWEDYFYRWYDGEKVPFKFHAFNSFTYDKNRVFSYGNGGDFAIRLIIPKGTTLHAIDIQDESIYPEEEEVLVGDIDKFYIDNIDIIRYSSSDVYLKTQ